jgi:hypothetical protein
VASVIWWTSQASATQIRKIGTTATDKVEAGMAATARYKEKVVKYGASVHVKKLGDVLKKVVAFDTAGRLPGFADGQRAGRMDCLRK